MNSVDGMGRRARKNSQSILDMTICHQCWKTLELRVSIAAMILTLTRDGDECHLKVEGQDSELTDIF